MENKVALFFHVLIEILKEIFEDINVNNKPITKIVGPVQKIKITETPLTTMKSEEKIVAETTVPTSEEDAPSENESGKIFYEATTTISTTIASTTVIVSTVATTEAATTPITTVSDVEESHLSKINIPQLPTEAATESTKPEDIFVTATTPTSTTPLISFEVPEVPKFAVTQPPTKAAVLSEETTTVPPSTTREDTVVVAATAPLINFEIPKLNIPQIISTKEISEASSTATTTVSTSTSTSSSTTTPSPTDPPTTTTTSTSTPSTPSTTQEMHYDDTDDNGIPFWLKVIDGIRCSMRDCSGVLIPTRSPYEQKELKNLTMTRFIREHGLPPCPCLELKELQKVLSSSNKESSNNSGGIN
uniref:Uncharacterized protein n=1 Tax=Panagrolaimus sp. ES5 TaxID=591445 RepID=A0AC34FCF1_9BILA